MFQRQKEDPRGQRVVSAGNVDHVEKGDGRGAARQKVTLSHGPHAGEKPGAMNNDPGQQVSTRTVPGGLDCD